MGTLEQLQSDLSNAVYAATESLERAEHERSIIGNGHHLRQLICDFAMDVARARWSDDTIVLPRRRSETYTQAAARRENVKSSDDTLSYQRDFSKRSDPAVAGAAWVYFIRTGKPACVEDAASMLDALEREGKSSANFGVDMQDMELCDLVKDDRKRIGLRPTREAMRRALAESDER